MSSVNGQTGAVSLKGANLIQPKDWAVPAGFVVPTAAEFSVAVGGGTCFLTDAVDGSGVEFQAAPGTGMCSRFIPVGSFGDGSEFVGAFDTLLEQGVGLVLGLAAYDSTAGKIYGFAASYDPAVPTRTVLGFEFTVGVGFLTPPTSYKVEAQGPVFQHLRASGANLIAGWSINGADILVSQSFALGTIDGVGIFAFPSGTTAGRLRAYKLTEA